MLKIHGLKIQPKPIGPFYQSKADAIKANPNAVIKEDAGRGYRKVVSSPLPQSFLGFAAIQQAVKANNLVIVGGGGGIPTILDANGNYLGVDGVIDKDFALSKLASLIDADQFVILTAVKHVYLNYNKPNQQKLVDVSVQELKKYIEQGMFASGGMLPKIEAAIQFVQSKPQAVAYIGALDELEAILQNASGTKIHA